MTLDQINELINRGLAGALLVMILFVLVIALLRPKHHK